MISLYQLDLPGGLYLTESLNVYKTKSDFLNTRQVRSVLTQIAPSVVLALPMSLSVNNCARSRIKTVSPLLLPGSEIRSNSRSGLTNIAHLTNYDRNGSHCTPTNNSLKQKLPSLASNLKLCWALRVFVPKKIHPSIHSP